MAAFARRMDKSGMKTMLPKLVSRKGSVADSPDSVSRKPCLRAGIHQGSLDVSIGGSMSLRFLTRLKNSLWDSRRVLVEVHGCRDDDLPGRLWIPATARS